MFFTEIGKRVDKKFQEVKELKTQIDTQLKQIDNIHNRIESLKNEILIREMGLKQKELAIEKICKEKSLGFPWLEDKLSEYEEYFDLRIANYLKTKKHPAESAAENIKRISKENRTLKAQYKVVKNYISYYESLFPWLTDYIGENLDNLLIQVTKEEDESNEDPVKKFITTSEYNNLTNVERNQRALDRYWRTRKENWMIGRDYERYVGYSYEIKGYTVKYQGILEGREDLGRDLICTKNNNTLIIQCKYWSKEKLIHENHINQLFGTTVKYILDNFNPRDKSDVFSIISTGNVVAKLITSTMLSETAKKFADSLGIQYIENNGMDFNYPCIKCNISRLNGAKIYHLPFDQQYDKTIIEFNKNEKYVKSVHDAESLGFRRAWRWLG
jgi:hypothetical protein